MPAFDPRTEVTDHIYRVTGELLGTPLAGPWRRAAAIVVDILAIALLANAPSVVFGIATAYVLLRASRPAGAGGVIRRSVRAVTRTGAAVMIFVVAVSLWNIVGGLRQERAQVSAAIDGDGVVSGRAGMLAGAEILALTMADDETEARRRAASVARRLEGAGFQEGEVAELLVGIGASRADRPWVALVVDSIAADLRSAFPGPAAGAEAPAPPPEAMIPAFALAIESGDSAEIARLRNEVAPRLAADTIGALQAALERQRTQVEELSERLDEAGDDLEEAREGGGIMGFLRNIGEDLGLGLGWSGLYFTAFVVLWRGQTPGKRLVGVRVVRLDGIPIGWWAAFERFGGYAAGLATGLLGFLQVFWDPNRQAVQDKISGTVVIQDRARTDSSGLSTDP
jgi:uncharacterized RDD family membrane protein YckC